MSEVLGSLFGTLYALFDRCKRKTDTALIDRFHLFDMIEIDQIGAMYAHKAIGLQDGFNL